MKKRKKWILLACLLLLAVGVVWLIAGNTVPQTTQYTISCPGLPAEFDGFRIAQVSDLHNAQLGENNERLLELLRQASPDLIVITGDLVDSRQPDSGVAVELAREAAKIAPCYYVTGNHESRLRDLNALLTDLEAAGVKVLRNEVVFLERGDSRVRLVGMDDCSFFPGADGESAVLNMELRMKRLLGEEYSIVLAHRAELFTVYSRNPVDLVFSGHAHGGQVRLPFVGGLYAPDQGAFPEYDSGVLTRRGTTLVISRGLGNSVFPLRVNNPPELVLAVLKAE